MKKSTDGLEVASNETELEGNVDETQYMVMSRDQNGGRNHNIKTDSSSFERVEQFKYLGTNVTSKILFRKKFKD